MRARRLNGERIYPAGREGLAARRLQLASGLHVRAIEAGPSDGRLVLCLHGLAANAYAFRHILPALGGAGWRAVAVDLKGHGLSDKPLGPDEYTSAALRAHALEILDALGATRATLVGHSMGGAIALDVAAARPERVERLALLGPAGLCSAAFLRLLRAGSPSALRPLLPHLVPRWLVRAVLRAAWGSASRPSEEDVDQYWAQSAAAEYAIVARDLVHAYRWTPFAPAALRGIAAPVLVVLGAEDRVFAAARAALLAGELPDARVHVVPGVGHLVAEEAPTLVNRLLLDFVGAP